VPRNTLISIVGAVADAMPKFNAYALRDIITHQTDRSAAFIHEVFEEAVSQFDGKVKYNGYRILSPEEKVTYELKMKKGCVDIHPSELELVRYEFIYKHQTYYSHIYLPYIKNGFIYIYGKPYGIMKIITESAFSKTENGITVRVTRAPLQFTRNKSHRLVSATSGSIYYGFIIGAVLHLDKNVKKDPPTILHYLLCKYGWHNTLCLLNIPHDDITFSTETADTSCEYFESCTDRTTGEAIYIKVKRDALKHNQILKFVTNLSYTLSKSEPTTISELTSVDGLIYKDILAIIIRPDTRRMAALQHINTHIASVDGYLDAATQERISSTVNVQNIYELLAYIFLEIDIIIISSSGNNLYGTHIDAMTGILINLIVRPIYYTFYHFGPKLDKTPEKQIPMAFNISANAITSMYELPNVVPAPSHYGDNWLLAIGASKLRMTGNYTPKANLSASSRFDPSHAVAESLTAFTGSNPGVTGLLNPYIPTGVGGNILMPDYADDINTIRPYLPKT
jgi:hypothetical protein